jgi:hypothetical protein
MKTQEQIIEEFRVWWGKNRDRVTQIRRPPGIYTDDRYSVEEVSRAIWTAGQTLAYTTLEEHRAFGQKLAEENRKLKEELEGTRAALLAPAAVQFISLGADLAQVLFENGEVRNVKTTGGPPLSPRTNVPRGTV